ncbi:hypothetical protein [Prevotella histicola]|uniref:hypothetical protein n=1 Tax=Prevotella histicola TaxID=470565 RepID=UPI001CAFA2FF|nr:hypothetical protein [Prevotella histicola]MBF1400959.1 hypothetical protein [Prevotella histicola]
MKNITMAHTIPRTVRVKTAPLTPQLIPHHPSRAASSVATLRHLPIRSPHTFFPKGSKAHPVSSRKATREAALSVEFNSFHPRKS